MPAKIEVLFSPAEFMALESRDLSSTVCVVFDVLRATSSIMTALANGALAVIPVAEIDEALEQRRLQGDLLLAGERDGLRICSSQTGGIDFDLGNSPREFTPAIVCGRVIVMTTTNGTRALRACAPAKATMIGSFLGMTTLASWIKHAFPQDLLLVCAGTFEESAYEDVLAAGALCELIWPLYQDGHLADSALMALQLYRMASPDILGAVKLARNGRRLLSRPELSDDLPYCIQTDLMDFLATAVKGIIRKT
jgi:2-phosphosulfolactate phosphatase